MEVIRLSGTDLAGRGSLPAPAHAIPRQVLIAKNLSHLIVVDGCGNACARHLAEKLPLRYDAWLDLENDPGIKKLGPFSTLRFAEGTAVDRVAFAIKGKIEGLRRANPS